MTLLHNLFAALAGIALFAATPTLAQTAADPYEQVYHAVFSGADVDTAMWQVARSQAAELVAVDPGFSALASDNPGITEELAAALHPFLLTVNRRLEIEYRDDFITMFRQTLAPDEAAAMTALFSSNAGHAIMQGAATNLVREATTQQTFADGPITREALARDVQETGRRSVEGLSEADNRELADLARRYPALFATINRIKPAILEIALRRENEPATPQEEQMLGAQLNAVLARYGLRLKSP